MNEKLNNPLRVAIVCPAWPLEKFSNGVISYTVSMRDALRRQGSEVTILSENTDGPTDDPGVIDLRYLDRDDRPLHRLWSKVAYRLWHDEAKQHALVGAILRHLHELKRRGGVDVVEVHEALGWARFLAPHSPVPVVLRLHGPWFLVGPSRGVAQDEAFKLRVEHERAGMVAAHGVTAPSQAVIDAVRDQLKLYLPRAAAIPTPIAVAPVNERWRADRCDPKRIVFIGRFDLCKGGDVLVEAFARLLKKVPDATLHIAGEDIGVPSGDGAAGGVTHLAEFVERHIPGAMQARRVEYHGFQPHQHLIALRRSAACCVVPSRFENYPTAAIEAQSQGCPLVAADVGGIPEIVQHERNGRLHRAADPADLATKLFDVLSSPARTAELAAQGVIDCQQRCDPARIAADTLAFYRTAIERFAARSRAA